MMSYPRLFLLLLPFFVHYTHAALTVSTARITANWDALITRRVAELRQIWPKCLMNEQFIWLPEGASTTPNATVLNDIYLRATDVDSKTAITSVLQRAENGTVYWDLRAETITMASWLIHREAVGWNWGVNNTITFNEAVRIVVNSTVETGDPGDWMIAYEERLSENSLGGWPDQLYWRFETLEGTVYLGQRDRIVRFVEEPDSANVTFAKRRLSFAEKKAWISKRRRTRRERDSKKTRG